MILKSTILGLSMAALFCMSGARGLEKEAYGGQVANPLCDSDAGMDTPICPQLTCNLRYKRCRDGAAAGGTNTRLCNDLGGGESACNYGNHPNCSEYILNDALYGESLYPCTPN